jgi:recombination protein RecT
MSNNMAMAVSNPKEMLAFLEKSRSAIQMALPKHLNPDRMMRLALTSFSTNPALRKCTAQSIIASVVVASQLGLEPGVAGQGYLIPYKDTCTFVPGWQGLVGLLNNTGRATAWTGSVFEGDTWEFQLGSSPRCNHIPGENYGDPNKLIWVYACGKVNGSEQPVIEAWPIERVIKHRDQFNKVGQRHYSYTNLEMYARKVVLLQVLKYMPRSIELNNAIVAADAAEVGKTTSVQDGVIIESEPTDIESPNFAPPPSLLKKKEAAAAPAAPRQEPPPPRQEPAPTESKKEEIIRILNEAGVPFDDFRDFVSLKRVTRDDVSAWGGYDEVPAEVYEKMTPIQMGECLRTYRTQGAGQA